jgi:hypothetical protein
MRHALSIPLFCRRRGGNAVLATLLWMLLLTIPPHAAEARVLEERDFERISEIRTLFVDLTTEIAQSLKRTDLASGEADCMNKTLQDLMQASAELGSYEYLITIESQMSDFGDDKAIKSILLFAVVRALEILETERKHMGQLSEQCSRFPLSAAKTKQAVQFIDATVAILSTIRPRL